MSDTTAPAAPVTTDKPSETMTAASDVAPVEPTSMDKGKGKAPAPAEEEDDEDSDEEMEEEDDDDDDEDLEDFAEIDPTAILPGRRTRSNVNYASEEALSKAGLKADENEEESEFEGDTSIQE